MKPAPPTVQIKCYVLSAGFFATRH